MSIPDSPEHPSISRLHHGECSFVLAVSGGGSRAISDLLSVPGASNTLLECIVPYSHSALCDYLGAIPDQSCSAQTARHMAMIAFERAQLLSQKNRQTIDKQTIDDQKSNTLFGLGCSAALGTLRERRGTDRCYVAIHSDTQTILLSLELNKSQSRLAQEILCSDVIIQGMCLAAGLRNEISIDELKMDRVTAPLIWQKLMSGNVNKMDYPLPKTPLIFPGAFNPPHEGHKKIAQIAAKKTGMTPIYEISITNVDKPNVDFLEMEKRQQYLRECELIFTRAATFSEKSACFPGAVFIVGIDTICRIAEARYYQNDETRRDLAIKNLAEKGHRFLVFGRLYNDTFLTLSDIELPKTLASICEEISEDEFREDCSSSELRSQ